MLDWPAGPSALKGIPGATRFRESISLTKAPKKTQAVPGAAQPRSPVRSALSVDRSDKQGPTHPRERVYRAPKTISRDDYLKDGHDRAFREGVYGMVAALSGLLRCRDIFGKALGLTGGQFAVLIGTAYLQETQGVAIRDLAAHVGLAAPHVTTEVNRLIGMGLMIKRQNKVDRRSVLVVLSPEGHAEIERISPLMQGVNDILFDKIDYRDFQIVSRTMRTLILNVEKVFAEIRWSHISKTDDT
jgi:DNA-binding MarR family transcriptional regulator